MRPPPTTPSFHSNRWSLTSYFFGHRQPDFLEFKTTLVLDLEQFLNRLITQGELLAADVAHYEDLTARFGHLSSYLACLSADNAGDEAVKEDEAWLATVQALITKIQSALSAALAEFDTALFQVFTASPSLADAGHSLSRLRWAGNHQMPAHQETLAADLNVDGLHAWGRLYETLAGRLEFRMTFPDGHSEMVPMARRRALMASPDRRLRQSAFEEGQRPWEAHRDTFASALNAIAGTRLTLCKRRGLDHFLDTPLFDGVLSRETLDALMLAIHENIELPRQCLRTAARLQGTRALHFYDLEAPQVPAPEGLAILWDDACELVQKSFDAAYPALGTYFVNMLDKNWIEAQPRASKRSGAFCTSSHLSGEQRVYMTYHETIHDLITLAHEVGHAWHSHLLREHRPLAADFPMTLAETASNFGEMILLDGLSRDPNASAALRAYLLDQEMNRAHAYLLNIPMRFDFERQLYEERHHGELSPSRLNRLMEDAQRKLYGDTLDPDGADPLFWASKMHFFFTGVSFYNFPYVFGYLLSQALFRRFKTEGDGFLSTYETFLKATGSLTCEAVAKDILNFDLGKAEFWSEAIRTIEPLLSPYAALADDSQSSTNPTRATQ